MNKIYAVGVILTTLTLSCSKPIDNNDKNTRRCASFKASIETPDTKTDYALNEDTKKAVFCWKGAEQINRMTWHTGETSSSGYFYNEVFSGTASDSGETTITFTGSFEGNIDSGYAFYPVGSSGAALQWASATNLRIWQYESIPYIATAPLKNLVPMVGKLNEAKTEYVFKPVSSILGIKMTNVPTTATKLTVSPSATDWESLGFSEAFKIAVNDGDNYMEALANLYNSGIQASDWFSGAKTRSLSFSNLSPDNDYTFYLPVPVSSSTGYNGLTITLYEGSTVLSTFTTTEKIICQQGHIVRLPQITVPDIAAVSISGDLNARQANFTYGIAKMIKYGITSSSSTTLEDIASSNITENSIESITPSSTGTYYLVYQGYKDDGITKVGPEKRVQFLYASNNVADIIGVYGINNSSDYKFTLAAIDPVEGDKNIQITTYNSKTSTYNGMTGNCKGVFDPASGTISIPSGQVLTKNDTNYYLVGTDASNFNSSTWTLYKANLVLILQPVAENASIKFNSDHFSVATAIDTGENKFLSGAGQHWSNGTPYLQKNN